MTQKVATAGDETLYNIRTTSYGFRSTFDRISSGMYSFQHLQVKHTYVLVRLLYGIDKV